MGFWKKLLFGKKNRYEEESAGENPGEVSRARVNMQDADERGQYVDNCLEQIAEASRQIELLSEEYDIVTAYLTDMEEIEALPDENREELRDMAKRIVELSSSREILEARKDRMKESDFRRVQRMEDEIEEGYQKLKETEEYQSRIKQDLNRLDGERSACQYRQRQWRSVVENTKGMAMICLVAVVLCVLMLAALQFLLEMDTRIGFLLTAGAAAVAITVIYLKHIEAKTEAAKCVRTMNRLILLQNKVKIRYVNNTNLLDYLYVKYGVDHAASLKRLWDTYLAEKKAREEAASTEKDLAFSSKELLQTLYHYRVKIPDVWPGQALALVDSREMVEIRHGLIQRRQILRKQIEYNRGLAERAQEIVKEVAKDYPEDAAQILEKVSRKAD